MKIYSSTIRVPAGAALAGNMNRSDLVTTSPGSLESHGFALTTGASAGWEVCSVDALYPGELAAKSNNKASTRIYAASHTHSAPMLDRDKPLLGTYSAHTVDAFRAAIGGAQRTDVSPDRCSIYCGIADVPIYRRYDFPSTPARRWLTRHLGLYPNSAQPLDKKVYVFLFEQRENPLFAIVYHACHPVSRHHSAAASADFIAALRAAVAQRFGVTCCLFFQGCAGDVRPNCIEPRIPWLPRSRFNSHFRIPCSIDDERSIDRAYQQSVLNARLDSTVVVDESGFAMTRHELEVTGLGRVTYHTLRIGPDLAFSFVPFEVSHRFHLEQAEAPPSARVYIVSCCNRVFGYLPYVDQLDAGGYEVDGSREFMNLKNRISVGRGALG